MRPVDIEVLFLCLRMININLSSVMDFERVKAKPATSTQYVTTEGFVRAMDGKGLGFPAAIDEIHRCPWWAESAICVGMGR